MSADFLVQLTEYRYLILGIVLLLSLVAIGALGKFVKGAIKWVFIIALIIFVLAFCGFFTSEEAAYLYDTFIKNPEDFNFEDAVLNSPT